jgi:hypothetical protein
VDGAEAPHYFGAGFVGFGSVLSFAMYSGYVVSAPPLAASTGTP